MYVKEGMDITMEAKMMVVKRIDELCAQQNINYYTLSYRAAVPISTLMNIIHGKNPTIGTISRLCQGFEITLKEFFSAEYFNADIDEE